MQCNAMVFVIIMINHNSEIKVPSDMYRLDLMRSQERLVEALIIQIRTAF